VGCGESKWNLKISTANEREAGARAPILLGALFMIDDLRIITQIQIDNARGSIMARGAAEK